LFVDLKDFKQNVKLLFVQIFATRIFELYNYFFKYYIIKTNLLDIANAIRIKIKKRNKIFKK